MNKNSIRKRAQKAEPVPFHCEACGATENLERHHPNYSKPDVFEVLCRPCHVKADQAAGYRRKKQPKACALCGTQFMPTHSKKHSLCSDACRSEMGRINARKRWGSGTLSLTSRVLRQE